jgi:hypothetical protein
MLIKIDNRGFAVRWHWSCARAACERPARIARSRNQANPTIHLFAAYRVLGVPVDVGNAPEEPSACASLRCATAGLAARADDAEVPACAL